MTNTHTPSPPPEPTLAANCSVAQVHRLRNEKTVYLRQYPERFQLLLNIGFEWEETEVPDEWELIILGKH